MFSFRFACFASDCIAQSHVNVTQTEPNRTDSLDALDALVRVTFTRFDWMRRGLILRFLSDDSSRVLWARGYFWFVIRQRAPPARVQGDLDRVTTRRVCVLCSPRLVASHLCVRVASVRPTDPIVFLGRSVGRSATRRDATRASALVGRPRPRPRTETEDRDRDRDRELGPGPRGSMIDLEISRRGRDRSIPEDVLGGPRASRVSIRIDRS